MIKTSGRSISIDGADFEMDYEIADAFETGPGQVVVLYDPDAYTSKFGQFRNLVAVSRAGARRWTADLPTSTSGDRYYRASFDGKLRAASVSSHVCEIDLDTGRILETEFVK